mgnify:CR=1 FL=1
MATSGLVTKEKLNETNAYISTHVYNTEVHVTAADKTKWNGAMQASVYDTAGKAEDIFDYADAVETRVDNYVNTQLEQMADGVNFHAGRSAAVMCTVVLPVWPFRLLCTAPAALSA